VQDKKIDITVGLNLKSADITVDLAEAPANVLFTGTNLMVTEAANLFTSIWKTDNTGTSLDTQITLPTTEAVNYFADWGDGNLEYVEGDGAAKTHTYDTAGTYTVKILTPTGTFSGLRFNNGGDKAKLLDVTQCGCLDISTTAAFKGCSNLTWTATDAPNISTTTLFDTFSVCLNFSGSVGNWDVGSVTNFATMFYFCGQFNQNLSSWDMSSATNISNMLGFCANFDQDLSSWDITSVTNATNFYRSATLSTANYDAILIGWAAQVVNSGVSISFGSSTYTLGGAAEAARDSLIGDGWTITDGGGV
jgi:surface protein